METRANAKVEVRTGEGGQKTLVGYASTFDHPYPVDMVTEIIDRKAFTRTLQEKPDVYALVGHDPARVLGRTKNGTLALTVDERGLRCEIVPVDTQEARDVVALVESGTLDAMSFGFKVKDQKFEYRDGGVFRRIMDCELHEVSVVAFPANADAKLSMRDRAEVRSLLRRVGYRGTAEVRAIKFDLPNLGAEVTDIKLDINGNKTLYVKFYAGKRTKVQTNGNLPETHKMDIDSIDPRMVEQELSAYFDEIGYETPLKGARHQQMRLPNLLSDIATASVWNDDLSNRADRFSGNFFGSVLEVDFDIHDRTYLKDLRRIVKQYGAQVTITRKGIGSAYAEGFVTWSNKGGGYPDDTEIEQVKAKIIAAIEQVGGTVLPRNRRYLLSDIATASVWNDDLSNRAGRIGGDGVQLKVYFRISNKTNLKDLRRIVKQYGAQVTITSQDEGTLKPNPRGKSLDAYGFVTWETKNGNYPADAEVEQVKDNIVAAIERVGGTWTEWYKRHQQMRLPNLLSDIETRAGESTTHQTLYIKLTWNKQGGKPVPHEAWVEDEGGDTVAQLLDGYDDWQEVVETYPFMSKQNALQNDASSWAGVLALLDIANKGDVVVTPSGKRATVR